MITYVVVIVPTLEEAQEFNRQMPKPTPEFKIEAYPTGAILHGLRHGASRPTIIIDLSKKPEGWSDEKYQQWHDHCVKPMYQFAAMVLGGASWQKRH